MDKAFTQHQRTEVPQLPRRHALCLPSVKPKSSNKSTAFLVLGRFWVSKYLRNLCCRGQFSNGFCVRRIRFSGMVVNNSVFCDSPGFVEGAAEMEGFIEKGEKVEERENGFGDSGGGIETFGSLLEDEGRECSSSSDSLTSEATANEEQSHSSSEESSSPLPLDWSVQKQESSHSLSSGDPDGAEKPHSEEMKLQKQGSTISGMSCSFSLLNFVTYV